MTVEHQNYYRTKVQELRNLPKIEQKSEEWYNIRRNMITASDFAQALGKGKFGTQKQLIQKKVMPRENETAISNTNPFFKWGHMFEPVACSIYEKMKNVTVHEFGLIQHPQYSFFGASPDGITDDGVMLEIKCPLKRKLTGEIPTQYYYQIQGQLDVCGLDDCDYLECSFELVDYNCWSSITDKIKGVFKDNGIDAIEYQKPLLAGEDTSSIVIGDDCKYWVLKEYYLIRVTRDKSFMVEKIEALKKVWDKIEYYRKSPESFTIEVQNVINIETEKYQRPTVNADSYLFVD